MYKPAAPSTATILRDAGYRTAYFGKWHCGIVWDQAPASAQKHWARYSVEAHPHRTPEHLRGGFEDWFAFEINNHPFESQYWHQHEMSPRKLPGYQTDALTDLAIEYLRNYQRDEPLLLVLSIEPPHFPLAVPEEFSRRFDPAKLQVPPNFVERPELRQALATYYAMIENLDWNIGRLMQALGEMPKFRDDTITTYFSDHGDFMGSHGLYNRKEYPHEESVRIPAIFHASGRLPAQGVIDGLFSLVDLLPTTLGLAGVRVPPWVQGMDFSPLLRGDRSFTGPDQVLIEMVNNPRWNLAMPDWRGVVTREHMYTVYETGEEMLFDLANDPYQLQNLARDTSSKPLRDQLRQRLLKLLADTREPFFDIILNHGVRPPLESIRSLSGRGRDPFW